MKKLIFMMILLIDVSFADAGNVLQGSGRYVLGQISDFRADQYLLDTETGRVWQMVKDKNDTTLFEMIGFSQSIDIKRYYMPMDTKQAKDHEMLLEKIREDEWKKQNNPTAIETEQIETKAPIPQKQSSKKKK